MISFSYFCIIVLFFLFQLLPLICRRLAAEAIISQSEPLPPFCWLFNTTYTSLSLSFNYYQLYRGVTSLDLYSNDIFCKQICFLFLFFVKLLNNYLISWVNLYFSPFSYLKSAFIIPIQSMLSQISSIIDY